MPKFKNGFTNNVKTAVLHAIIFLKIARRWAELLNFVVNSTIV